MSGSGSKKERKEQYFEKIIKLMNTYQKILLVTCDNIGSNHMQKIRVSLRGKAVLLMGKNTMMRKAIRNHLEENPKWEQILPHICYNVGLIFTNHDLQEIKSVVLASKVPAPAKVGGLAPNSVVIPKGMTTLEPTKTAFLQALNIASKITRNQIEILNDVNLIKEGDKVGSSEATLLQMLDIRPFEYGLKITVIYDSGALYAAKILDLKDEDIVAEFINGVANVAGLSLALHFPTLASFPHAVVNGYKRVLAVSLATDYDFDQAKALKTLLSDPEALKKAAAAAASSSTTSSAPAAAVAAAPEVAAPVEEKEESAEMEFDLFS